MITDMILQNKNIKKDLYFLSKDGKLFVGYEDNDDCLVARWSTPTALEVEGSVHDLNDFIKEVNAAFGYKMQFKKEDIVLFWNYWQKETNGMDMIEGTNPIKKSADKMRILGYTCVVDTVKPSIAILDKFGNNKFYVEGRKAEDYIEDFAEDPNSLDPSFTIEDWMLGVYLFGRK